MKKAIYILTALIVLTIILWLAESIGLDPFSALEDIDIPLIMGFVVIPGYSIALIIITIVSRLKVSENTKVIANIAAIAISIFIGLYMFNYLLNLVGPA